MLRTVLKGKWKNFHVVFISDLWLVILVKKRAIRRHRMIRDRTGDWPCLLRWQNYRWGKVVVIRRKTKTKRYTIYIYNFILYEMWCYLLPMSFLKVRSIPVITEERKEVITRTSRVTNVNDDYDTGTDSESEILESTKVMNNKSCEYCDFLYVWYDVIKLSVNNRRETFLVLMLSLTNSL